MAAKWTSSPHPPPDIYRHMANDNINSFEKCQRKPPGTFPCQSVGARSSQLEARCSLFEPSSSSTVARLLLFLSFLPLPLLATVINEQQMLWVWLEWLKWLNGCKWATGAGWGLPRKRIQAVFIFIYIYIYIYVFISIKTNHTENVILQKAQSQSAPGIVNMLFCFLSRDSLPRWDISKAIAGTVSHKSRRSFSWLLAIRWLGRSKSCDYMHFPAQHAITLRAWRPQVDYNR